MSEAFVRIELDDGSEHEWGAVMSAVPTVGDFLWLYFDKPGEQTGNDFLEARVVKRHFPLDSNEVWITAASGGEVPEGYIADSPQWPSDDMECYTVRKALGLLEKPSGTT